MTDRQDMVQEVKHYNYTINDARNLLKMLRQIRDVADDIYVRCNEKTIECYALSNDKRVLLHGIITPDDGMEGNPTLHTRFMKVGAGIYYELREHLYDSDGISLEAWDDGYNNECGFTMDGHNMSTQIADDIQDVVECHKRAQVQVLNNQSGFMPGDNEMLLEALKSARKTVDICTLQTANGTLRIASYDNYKNHNEIILEGGPHDLEDEMQTAQVRLDFIIPLVANMVDLNLFITLAKDAPVSLNVQSDGIWYTLYVAQSPTL